MRAAGATAARDALHSLAAAARFARRPSVAGGRIAGTMARRAEARAMATNKPSRMPLPEKWVAAANKEIKSDDADTKLLWHTAEGITIKPVYTRKDIEGEGIDEEELPGEFPFTRGPRTTMYTHKPWTVRQYAGFRRESLPILTPLLVAPNGLRQIRGNEEQI